jgi:hypothetical protein
LYNRKIWARNVPVFLLTAELFVFGPHAGHDAKKGEVEILRMMKNCLRRDLSKAEIWATLVKWCGASDTMLETSLV